MQNTVLLIIDVQKGFHTEPSYWGARNNLQAEENIGMLLAEWRKYNRPIIHIKHMSTNPNSPLRPGQIGNDFQEVVSPLPNEVQFTKSVNSAFINTNLEAYLHDNEFESLVIIGLTTDHCVSTTTRMAGNLGFQVTLVSDATATFEREFGGKHYSAEEMHNLHLASLDGEFCTVVSTAEILETGKLPNQK